MCLKKWVSLLLASLILLPACGLADTSVNWLYSFSAGDILSGGEMDGVRDFLDAVRVSLTSQKRDGLTSGEATLLSGNKPAFTMRAALSDSGEMGLYCSLTGNCTLMCRKDQLNDFLANIVRMLGERSILKESGLTQAEHLAESAGSALVRMIETGARQDLQIGINPDLYLNLIGSLASETEARELDGQDPECPGAVLKRTWILTEQELNALVDLGIRKLKRVPLLSDEFEKGSLRIGGQPVTEAFLRDLFASMQGETTLEAFQDAEGRVVLMRLHTPDIRDIIDDPTFSRVRGVSFSVTRSENPQEGRQESLTEMKLIGLEGTLLSVRMQKGPGADIPDLPSKKVYRVGDMNTQELWDLIQSLRFTIATNAISMILDLPRIVFDTLVDRIF